MAGASEPAGTPEIPRHRSKRAGRAGGVSPETLLSAGNGYRLLFQHMDRMVCTLDLEGRFISVNPAGERLTGYSGEELRGRFAVELIAPDVRDDAVRQFQRRLAGDDIAGPDESVLVRRDGRHLSIEVASSLLSRDGQPVGVLGVVRDISAEKSVENALSQSEDRFQALLEAAPDGVVIADRDGQIVLVNAQTEELFGYRRDELVGRSIELLLPESVRAAHAGHRASYLSDPRTRQMGAGLELFGRRRDGEEFPVDISLSPLQTDEGVLVLAAVRDVTERRQAEEALRQSEERFRSAFSFASIGMALVARDGRWLQVNDALCELVGYSAEELLTKTFQDITHPDDLEDDLEFVRQMLAGEIRTYHMEKRYFRKDGDVVWILLSVSLVRAKDGSPVHFISQIQDITERKLAQEAMKESEARLAEAQQIAGVGSWERNLVTDEVKWSAEMFRLFGVDPEAGPLSYQRFFERIHPDDRTNVEAARERAGEIADPFAVEYRIVLSDGTTRWIHSRGDVLMVDGAPIAMVGTAQDITESKAAEEALAEAELRYRTLIEQLPLATYIRPLDMADANLYCSPQVLSMLGYSAEEWETNPGLLAAIVHPDDRDRVIAVGERVRTSGQPSRQEYRYISRGGRVVWVQDETYVVRDERGEPLCVQGYLLDITERKMAEEERDRLRDELHHAQKLEALGRLAGGVAHDFNNVLTAIKGYGELLLVDLEPGSPARHEAEQIRRAAEQAAVLPQQLLAFGRKQVLEPRLLDVDAAVSEAIDLLRRIVRESIEVVTTFGAASAHVLADPSQLEQVLLNLAVNARDAMLDGGTLRIATRREPLTADSAAEQGVVPGEYAVISVADTGHGMDSEIKARVFEPFFTTKAVGQGSGLGLATAYGTVRQSGGFIQVESEPGRGATFDVYLPCTEAGDLSGSQASTEPETPTTAATVLLVEDEEMVRDVARMALERSGYRVVTAACAGDALGAWNSEVIDVLVTDMVMPGMGGRELADRVLHIAPATPIVFMSGYTDEPPVVEMNGSTPSFLQKPFTPAALAGAVADVLERASNRHANGAAGHNGKVITCLVADDHPAVLDSVSRFLEENGFDVVSRVSRGDDALDEIVARRPVVALLDVTMEPFSGIEVARRAAAKAPETQVVLYTGLRDGALLAEALDAGARGFALKEAPLSELARGLTLVAGGATYVDSALSGALARGGTSNALSPLTRREREILGLLAEGMTNEKVAAALGISAETVQSHVHNAMGKLEADTRTEAVATAIRQSFIK